VGGCGVGGGGGGGVHPTSMHTHFNRFFHFEALVHASIILVLPPFPLPVVPKLVQYYCTTITQYTTSSPTPLL